MYILFVGKKNRKYLYGVRWGAVHTESSPLTLVAPSEFIAKTWCYFYSLISFHNKNYTRVEWARRSKRSSPSQRISIANSHFFPLFLLIFFVSFYFVFSLRTPFSPSGTLLRSMAAFFISCLPYLLFLARRLFRFNSVTARAS